MRTRTQAKPPTPPPDRDDAPAPTRNRAPPNKPTPETLRVPHDVVNERVVIAAVLVDETARQQCLAALTPGHFHGEGHAEVWSALQELERRKLSFDPATLRSIAPKLEIKALVGLMHERPKAPPNLSHHVEMMLLDNARITLARGPLRDLLDALRDPRTQPERLRAIAQSVGRGFEGYGSKGNIRYAPELVAEQTHELARRREGHAVYSSGIPALDTLENGRARLIPGFAPGNITVWTGLSGSGKTTTLANAMIGWAKQKRKVLVGAWEVGAAMSLEIAAIIDLGLSRSDVSEGLYDASVQLEIEQKMLELGQYISFFEMSFGRGRGAMNDHQLDKIEQVVVDSGCEIFVADLFRRALKETNPDDEEQALYRMQDMAKRTKRHFTLVQQQSIKKIEAEGRSDKRPSREGIKGSGGWVEVADQIIAWHRPAMFKDVVDDRIEAHILKQRYGKWPLAVEIEFNPEFGHLGRGKSIVADAWADDLGLGGDSEFEAFAAAGKGKRR